MRILIVTDNFPPRHFGGMAQHAWHIANYLGKNGHEARVLSLWADRGRAAQKDKPFTVKGVLTKRFPRFDFGIVAREARRFGAEAVHVCTAGLLDGRLAGRVPVVTRVVGNDFLRPWCGYNLPLPLRGVLYRIPVDAWKSRVARWETGIRKARVRRYLQASDVVVANSDWTRERLFEIGVRAERIRVVVGGMDAEVFRPRGDRAAVRKELEVPPNIPVIVGAGNLIGKKGFDTVIRALGVLAEKGIEDLHYVILGDGPEEARLRALAKELGVASRVRFAGRKDQRELARYYQAADIYVLISREETMGRTYFEAGGCGIPVIGARVGGVPSVVVDGRNGLLVDDPEDVEAVAATIAQLLGAPELRARMGAEGARLARERFSWDRVGAEFERVLVGGAMRGATRNRIENRQRLGLGLRQRLRE